MRKHQASQDKTTPERFSLHAASHCVVTVSSDNVTVLLAAGSHSTAVALEPARHVEMKMELASSEEQCYCSSAG